MTTKRFTRVLYFSGDPPIAVYSKQLVLISLNYHKKMKLYGIFVECIIEDTLC